MGIACARRRDAAEMGSGERVPGCCRVVALVMTKRVNLRVVRGRDTSRRSATGHAKFSNSCGLHAVSLMYLSNKHRSDDAPLARRRRNCSSYLQ